MKDDHRSDEGHVETEELKKSKTRRKKEMIELQKLGEQLLKLPDAYLKKSGVPEELLEALRAAKKITSFGARRRQIQYIGAIMREVDPGHITSVIETFGHQDPPCAPAGKDLKGGR
ncbi:MAG: DUF615 domain-containing protein [Desulfobacterota bacterium]|jgi:ribosome-associated protein|nr:DUF615 domain-containing protein [Thermodesulfobacteriota bacterium]